MPIRRIGSRRYDNCRGRRCEIDIDTRDRRQRTVTRTVSTTACGRLTGYVCVKRNGCSTAISGDSGQSISTREHGYYSRIVPPSGVGCRRSDGRYQRCRQINSNRTVTNWSGHIPGVVNARALAGSLVVSLCRNTYGVATRSNAGGGVGASECYRYPSLVPDIGV